jgi:tetratricopeptide (TPR) repeat protein
MKYVNTEHRVMADAFDDDQLALGLKADGIAGIISTGLAGSVAWLLSRFTPFEPAIGAFGGSLIGAISYVIFAINRNKKRLEHLAENEELRKKMALQYSSKLSEGGESLQLQEWNKIKLEIASSTLTESNQRILERELVSKHNITETVIIKGISEEKYAEQYAMAREMRKQLQEAKQIQDEDKKKILILESESLAQKLQKSGFVFEIPDLLDLGDAAMKIGDMEMSGAYYSKSQRNSRNTGDLENEALAVEGLIRLSEMKKDFVKQEKFAQRLVEMWTTVDNMSGLANALNEVGRVMSNQEKFKDAKEKYTQSLNICNEIEAPDAKWSAIMGLKTVSMYLDLENFGEPDFKPDSDEETHSKWADELEQLSTEIFTGTFNEDQDSYHEAFRLEMEGWLASRNGDIIEANRLTRESLLLSRKHGYRPMEADVLASLARIAESQGNTEMAKIHKQESQKILTEIGLPINEEE